MEKIFFTLLLFVFSLTAHSADLMQVYQQALASDPTYQEAVSQRLADKEGVTINRAALLPQATLNGGPTLTKFRQPGVEIPALSSTAQGYSMTLSLTQTVFNYSQMQALAGAHALSKQADAALNAATQDLMLRVSQAYFAILQDEENVAYSRANQQAFKEQYNQIRRQYKSGLKTQIEVDTAKASHDSAAAAFIAAQTTLTNDKENLRAITDKMYPSLAKLSERFPLVAPQPANLEQWVQTAQEQNWAVKAQEFASQAARENIKQQFAAHLPTVSLQGTYNTAYNNNVIGNTAQPNGILNPSYLNIAPAPFSPNRAHSANATISLNVGIPLFSGGKDTAQTNQARYEYQASNDKLTATLRATIHNTRQSYLGVTTSMQQIQADKAAITSNLNALASLQAGYAAGTQTLLDVLNQQQKVFQAQTQYATDRYAYVNNLLALKKAAGTLSEADLQSINAWLLEGDRAVGLKTHYHGMLTANEKSADARLRQHLALDMPDLTLSP